jgi:DNA-binding response OmpR family regulator
MAAPHILLVEDDPRIREIVERGLTPRGFTITSAEDGIKGAELATKLEVDLLLLDLRLPGLSGLEVLQEVRMVKPELPIIALTASDDVESKVGGLEAGADDYITKPFVIEELAARIRARLRRHQQDRTALQAGGLTVDLASHRAFLDDKEISLSARELELLVAFLQHGGQVLSRAQLLKIVWEVDFDPGSNVVDVHVAALRRKLGAKVIETVRGFGYRFVPPRSASADLGGERG